MSFYEVKVVQRAAPHAVITTFDADHGDGDTRQKATVEHVTRILNEPGSFVLSLPLFHPATAQVVPLMCEVQVWRNGVIIAWGVPLQPELQGGAWVVNCPGLLWYLTRRVFGPITTNYLANPNFATDLTGWTAVGCTATRSTAIRLRGPGTARLVATTSGNNYLQHTFTVSTGGLGLVLFLAGSYWIDPAVTFTAGAFEERGLYISAPNSLPDGTPQWEPINMSAPVGEIEPVVTELHLPANLVNQTVTVRLYAPHGAIHWGALSVTALESVSSEPAGTDVTEMMRRIVAYCHTAYDYGFATSTPAAQQTEIVAYQFADLGNVFAALKSYPDRGLADFDMVLTPTTRTFTTYAPRKGSYKPGNPLTVPGTNVNLMAYRQDGEQTSTRIIRRGTGRVTTGPSRQFALAMDTAPLGGLPLDDVADGAPEIGVDGLDGYAITELERLKAVVTLPDFEVPAEGWWGVVDVGDTVPVTVDWGAVQESMTRRIVSMRLIPTKDWVAIGLQAE